MIIKKTTTANPHRFRPALVTANRVARILGQTAYASLDAYGLYGHAAAKRRLQFPYEPTSTRARTGTRYNTMAGGYATRYRRRRAGRIYRWRGRNGRLGRKRNRYLGRRRRGLGLRRLLIDTRKRSELKKYRYNPVNRYIVNMGDWKTTPSTGYMQITQDIVVGTGPASRVGTKVQLRSIRLRALLTSSAEDYFIRWAIIKTRTHDSTAQTYMVPNRLFWEEGSNVTNDPLWNAPFLRKGDSNSPAGTADYNHWSTYFKMIKNGIISMPTYKLAHMFNVILNFKPGHRPIQTYTNSNTDTDTKGHYYLLMWSNDATGGAHIQLRDICVDFTWYDA